MINEIKIIPNKEKDDNVDNLKKDPRYLNPERLEEGLELLRNRGQEKFDKELKKRRELLNRPKQLKDSYNLRSVGQKLPFRYDNTSSMNEGKAVLESKSEYPLDVSAGTMAITSKERELVLNEIADCAACFSQGKNSKGMVHMVHNNNHRNYGFVKKDGSDYNPISSTIEKIFSEFNNIEDIEDLTICLIFNYKDKSKRDYIKEFEAEMKKRGIKNVKIQETLFDRAVVYHSPLNPNKILMVGERDGKKDALEVVIEGDDIFLELD